MAWAGSRPERRQTGRCVPRTARFSSTYRRQGRRTGQRRSWPRSIPSNGRSRSLATGRSACWPGRGPARPGRWRTGSPTSRRPGRSVPAGCSPSRSPRGRRGSCGGGCGSWARSCPGPAWSRCRRARSTPRRCVSSPISGHRRSAASRRGCWSPRSACWPRRRGGPAVRAGLTELRDAAAEIEWAKVTQVRPDDYATASSSAGRSGPFDGATLGRLYAGYEALRTERNLVDFESVLELTAAIVAELPGGRPLGPGPVRLLRRGRVPGRQPAAEARCSTCGSGAGMSLRGRRPAADHLLLHRRVARVPDRLHRRVSRPRPSSGWCGTTARRLRSSRWPTKWPPGRKAR